MNTRFLLPALFLSFAFLIQPAARAQSGKPLYTITVTRGGSPLGEIAIELYPDIAPKHAHNFDSLVSIGFYDRTAFHRVIPGFMIQGGDPNSRDKPRSTWGTGENGQATVPAEFTRLKHLRGRISAARTPDPNSATSQFFICVATAAHLDGSYSVYGGVVTGLNIVDSIVASPRDANDNPNQKVEMTIRRTGIDTSMPGPTALVSPADGTPRISATSTLVWGTADAALLYQLQISEQPDFSSTLIDTLVPQLPFKLDSIRRGQKTYYWHVRATNGGRRGEFSEIRRFTTGISSPSLASPDNKATSVPTATTLTWHPVKDATSYRVEVATSLLFTTLFADLQDITDTSVTVPNLATNKRYYWRVSALDSGQQTPASGVWSFTTATSGVAADADMKSVQADVSGPDASGDMRLGLRLPTEQTVTIFVTDITGHEILRLSRMVEAGEQAIHFNTGLLAEGAYLLRLDTGSEVHTAKFMVVR